MSLGISYKFSAIDGMTNVINKIAKSTSAIDDKIVMIGKSSAKVAGKYRAAINSMGRSTDFLSRELKGLAITGAAFFGAKNVLQKGMEFEDSMAGLAAITGATGEDLKLFGDESIRMSKKFGASAAQIAESFLDIGSAKSELLKSPRELAKIVEQTNLLSKGGGVGLNVATEAMTKSLNIFRKGADSAEHFSDIMIQGTVVGAAKLDEFAQSILNAGGGAVNAGLDFKDTTALIQLLSKGGEVGARAGTALNAFFSKMSKDFGDVDISSGEKLIKFLDKLDDATKKGFNISAEFGEEAARAVRIMLAQKEFLPSFMKDIGSAGGATEKAASLRMATTSTRLAQLRARIDIGMLRLFERLEPMLTKMTIDFTNWIDNLKDADINSFLDTLSNVGTVLKGIGETIGMIIDGWVQIAGLAQGFRQDEAAKIAANQTSTPRNFTDLELQQMMSSGGSGSFGSGLESELPPGMGVQKNQIEITVKDPTGVVQSVKEKSIRANPRARQTRVKTNMSGV